MFTAHIKYSGGLRTEATHVKSGQQMITDAPPDNHGKGEAFSPTDLTCTSLGACILTTMGIAANTHGIDMDGATTDITKHMGSGPRRIVKIDVILTLPHNNYTEKERKILEHAALTCPVALSLHPDIEQNVEFVYGGK